MRTASEDQAIRRIARRAIDTIQALRAEGATRLSVAMDLTDRHANGCPLDLEALLHANDFNFAHDVLGIRRAIDRTTGKLDLNFVPRFHRRARKAA